MPKRQGGQDIKEGKKEASSEIKEPLHPGWRIPSGSAAAKEE